MQEHFGISMNLGTGNLALGIWRALSYWIYISILTFIRHMFEIKHTAFSSVEIRSSGVFFYRNSEGGKVRKV